MSTSLTSNPPVFSLWARLVKSPQGNKTLFTDRWAPKIRWKQNYILLQDFCLSEIRDMQWRPFIESEIFHTLDMFCKDAARKGFGVVHAPNIWIQRKPVPGFDNWTPHIVLTGFGLRPIQASGSAQIIMPLSARDLVVMASATEASVVLCP
jgi:hypothetical protein